MASLATKRIDRKALSTLILNLVFIIGIIAVVIEGTEGTLKGVAKLLGGATDGDS